MGAIQGVGAVVFSADDLAIPVRLASELLRARSRSERMQAVVRNLKQMLHAESACSFISGGQTSHQPLMELYPDGWKDWQTQELTGCLATQSQSDSPGQPLAMKWLVPNARIKATVQYAIASYVSAGSDDFITLAFTRRNTAFADREISILNAVYGSEVAVLISPTPSTNNIVLSKRLSQVHAYLMSGDSEKQIAKRLQLSRHTVHFHIKTIYRRFNVNSRCELLSLSVDPLAKRQLSESITG